MTRPDIVAPPWLGDGQLEQTSCNLCGADDAAPRVHKQGLTVVECRRCHLVYVNPRLVYSASGAIYSEDYFQRGYGQPLEEYGYADYVSHAPHLRATFERRLRALEPWIRVEGPAVLDVGCATGGFLDVCEARGWRAAGIDVSPMVAHAQRPGRRIYQGRFDAMAFEAESFDAVTFFETLEHVANPLAALEKAHRVLRPGGVLAVTVPNLGGPMARILGSRWTELRPREHLYYFTARTLARLCERAGFRVVRVRWCGYDVAWKLLARRLEEVVPLLGRGLQRCLMRCGWEARSVYVPTGDLFLIAQRLPR